MKAKKKPKLKGWYVKKLDKIFSEYIRQSYANDFGMLNCYTCGLFRHWKDVDNGHFLSRAKMATRWSEDNCRPQCKGCNGPKGGEIAFYSQRLMKELGNEKFDDLITQGKSIRQWTIKELKSEIEKYQKKIKEL